MSDNKLPTQAGRNQTSVRYWKKRITDLEHQLAEKDKRIAELEAELADALQNLSEKATECSRYYQEAANTEAELAKYKLKWQTGIEHPEIVCLCGSTRFKDTFDDQNYHLTMSGAIVLTVGFFMHAIGNQHGESVGCTPAQKKALDELHKRKIDLCDRVFVLNVGGYIGESTWSEIEYAHKRGKPVSYLEVMSGNIHTAGPIPPEGE